MIDLNTLGSIWQTVTNQDLIAKFFLIIISFIFFLFALIIARQVYILNNILKQKSFSPIFETVSLLLILLAFIHLIFVILIV